MYYELELYTNINTMSSISVGKFGDGGSSGDITATSLNLLNVTSNNFLSQASGRVIARPIQQSDVMGLSIPATISPLMEDLDANGYKIIGASEVKTDALFTENIAHPIGPNDILFNDNVDFQTNNLKNAGTIQNASSLTFSPSGTGIIMNSKTIDMKGGDILNPGKIESLAAPVGSEPQILVTTPNGITRLEGLELQMAYTFSDYQNSEIRNLGGLQVKGISLNTAPPGPAAIEFLNDVDHKNNNIDNVNELKVETITSSGFNIDIDKGIIQKAGGYDNVLTLRDTSTTSPTATVGYITVESSTSNPAGAIGGVGDPAFFEVVSYGARDIRLDAANSKYEFKSTGVFQMPTSGTINTDILNANFLNGSVLVTTEADLPNPITAGNYIIMGDVNISSTTPYTLSGDCSFYGLGREGESSLNFQMTTAGFPTVYCLNISDHNVAFNNLKLTNQSASYGLLQATNAGKDKIFTMTNCSITDCKNDNVVSILGFDLVDLNNVLFQYNYPTLVHFKHVMGSKLQLSSCEFLRQLQRGSSPAMWGTAPMIELDNGFGAINVNGCLIHPQQTQNGITIGASYTSLESVIAGNTFIRLGLTTGILADYTLSNNPELIISNNSGIKNEKAILDGQDSGNTTYTATVAGQFEPVIFSSSFSTPLIQRFEQVTGTFGFKYIGKNPIYGLISANLTADHDTKGADDCVLGIRLTRNLTSSIVAQLEILVEDGKERTFSISTTVELQLNDQLEFVCQNITAGNDPDGFRAISLNATIIEI